MNALDSSGKEQKKMDLTKSVFISLRQYVVSNHLNFAGLSLLYFFLSDSCCHLVRVQVQIIRKRGANFLCPLNKQKLCDMNSFH